MNDNSNNNIIWFIKCEIYNLICPAVFAIHTHTHKEQYTSIKMAKWILLNSSMGYCLCEVVQLASSSKFEIHIFTIHFCVDRNSYDRIGQFTFRLWMLHTFDTSIGKCMQYGLWQIKSKNVYENMYWNPKRNKTNM